MHSVVSHLGEVDQRWTGLEAFEGSIDMFATLIVAMVSQECIYIQTHQNIYIKYIQFWYTSNASIKL